MCYRSCHECGKEISKEAKKAKICPHCFYHLSTTKSENDIAKMKLAGWIVLGIVIIAPVYYLDLLEFIGL